MPSESAETPKRPHIPEAEELPGDPGALWSQWARPGEVDAFDEFVRRFWAKELGEDEFRQFRLQNGVYGQSQPGLQMVRVKIPAGGLTAVQLEALAELAATTPRGVAHVTTRQNFQYHFVELAKAAAFLERINAVGLTTREACSNTVRTITACHRAGVCRGEAFDVSPYAAAASAFFLRNPLCQSLPRKFKISFSGCPTDCALPLIHDIGAVAATRPGPGGAPRRGFVIFVGGGLGASPRAARPLEEFTPAEELLVSLASIVRVFDRCGNREQKALARLKFAVEKLGWENFRAQVLKDRERMRFATAGQLPAPAPWAERPAGGRDVQAAAEPAGAAYARWKATCVEAQKQPGYALVHVRLVLGDVGARQLRALAEVVRRCSNGTLRTTAQQNFAIRWVRVEDLPRAFEQLSAAGLARPSAERLADVTSCPGADTCQIGITSSRGLARSLTQALDERPALADLAGVRVKVSGCPNSCGQHHLASIGFFGGARKVADKTAPTYQMMLAGALAGAAPGGSPFARAFLKIPAAKVQAAVLHVVELYNAQRLESESFNAFIERYGFERLKSEMAEFAQLPPYEQAPELYRDVGGPQEEVGGSGADFKVQTGQGECAR